MRRVGGAAFPVGLYGMLLLALCWLAVPAVFAPLERLALAVPTLPHRLIAALGTDAQAATDAEAVGRIAGLRSDLQQRLLTHQVQGGRSLLPATWVPVLSRVVAVERIGGGGAPAELRLEHRYRDLAGCQPFVTQGDALLGRLAVCGHGLALDDDPGDHARVLLLHHPQAAPVAAAMPLPDGGLLRMVVQPAARVDQAPLRVHLWDDPYRAAGLRAGGEVVKTMSLPALATGAAPPDLRIGTSQVWGYGRGDDVLTIGMFVEPAVDVRSLSHVVLWTEVEPPAPLPPPRLSPCTLWRLPGGVGGRWLLAADGPVPDGAAVVADGVCLGIARGLSFGQALVTSFPTSRQRLALLLLPDDPQERPRELWGEVVRGGVGTAWFSCRGGDRTALPPGFLFTGSNGPHCPAGLLLGRALPQPGQPDQLAVVVPTTSDVLTAQVVVAEDR